MFGKKEDNFTYYGTELLRTWENFAKNHFSEKILGNFFTQEFYTVLKSVQNSASFDTLCAQF